MTQRLSRRTLLRSSLVVGAALGASSLLACTGGRATRGQGEDDGGVPDHPLSGLTDFEGKPVALPAIVGRGATVLDFWASWCGPCRASFPYLDQLARTWMPRGLDVLGVCVDEKPEDGWRFFASMRPHFPVAWDPSGEVQERFGVQSLPTTLLLDAAGNVVVRHTGFDVGEHRFLESEVRRLLGA